MIRLWLVLALSLLVVPSAFAMEHFTDVLQDTKGNIIGQATVHVYLAGTTTHATLYSDNGVTPKANPFSSNTFDGSYDFYAANGVYDLVFSKPGVTFNAALTRRRSLFDMSDGGVGGGVSDFSQLLSGANTQAAMVVGNSASLTYTGTGIINASQFHGNVTISYLDGGTGFTTAPDNMTLIGNGSGWQQKAWPACNNPTTSKILFDDSTNTILCGTDQSAGGGVTFDTIGSGTNTTMAGVVSTGASLTVSGTGSITSTNFWPNVVTVNAGNSPYTALTTNATLLCDTTAAGRTITLPAATNKVILTVFNLGSNTCTINRAGADTITTGVTSGTSFVLRNAGSTFWLQPDGSSIWYVGG